MLTTNSLQAIIIDMVYIRFSGRHLGFFSFGFSDSINNIDDEVNNLYDLDNIRVAYNHWNVDDIKS